MKKILFAFSMIVLVLIAGCADNSSATTRMAVKSQDEIDTACMMLEDMAKEYFDYCEVTCVEDYFMVNISGNGIAKALETYKNAGYDENFESWVYLKDGFLTNYDILREFLNTMGFEDYDLLLNIVNDRNYDNVLLSIAYGEVIYDYMAE